MLYARAQVPYDLGPMRRPLLVSAPMLFAVVGSLAPTVDAAPKGKAAGKAARACGVNLLPLSEGNSWTYQSVPPATPAPAATAARAPAAPKSFTITVTKVESKGPETVVSLEEKLTYDYTKDPKKPNLEERLVTSTITCSASKFDVSPGSFFFAGEPGGISGMTLDKIERKGTTWKLAKGTLGDDEWADDMMIHWTRKPHDKSGAKPASGKLEVERRFTPNVPEEIFTKTGKVKAEKFSLVTTGRVTLDTKITPELKPYDIPADWITIFWYVDGTGIVQVQNANYHVYQLADSTVK